MDNYNADSIKTMPFGESCIKKIGMYLSADMQQALQLGLRELIYNSQDEFEQGYGNLIKIEINSDKHTVTVEDNARGIPVGIREDGINSVEAACTLPHSGAKHDNEVYAGAVGINGIGLKVVCHTSSSMLVAIKRGDKKLHTLIFQGDDKGSKLLNYSVSDATAGTGTRITYIPNPLVYKTAWFNKDDLLSNMQELVYFAKGLTIEVNFDGDKHVFLSKNGLADALNRKVSVHKNKLYYNAAADSVKVELALQWCKEGSSLLPYANNLYVPEGGAFMTGFKTSLTKAFNTALGTSYSGDIIRKYLDGYVSVKVAMPQFSNQAKTALANPEARTVCSKAATDAIKEFFGKYPKDGELIKDLLDKEQKAEDAAARAREQVNKIVAGGKNMNRLKDLPTKLVDCNTIGGELYICEGE